MKGLFFVFLQLMVVLVWGQRVYSQSTISSDIEVNTRLTKVNSPYLISSSLTINAGVTLQIDAGVKMIMEQGVSINNYGRLIFNGDKSDYIRLETENGKRWRYINNYGILLAHFVSSRNGTRFISCNGDTLIIKNCFVDETTGAIGDDLISAHHTPFIEIMGCELNGDPTSSRIDAIDLDGVSNVLIEGNHISYFPDDAIDIGSLSSNILIQHNTISNCDMGISVGESSKAFADFNLITFCGAGIQSHTGAVVTANQNTFYGNSYAIRALHYDSQPTSSGTAYVSNSIIANCTVSAVKLVENSIVTFTYCLSDIENLPGDNNILGNPDFVDTENGDFYLGENSDALNVVNSGTDPDGTALDLGVYSRFNAPIIINEIASSNLSIAPDEVNEYDDWFEIFNTTDAPINMLGYFLSDKPDNPMKFEIKSDLFILPDSSLLFWADDSLNQGKTHVSFGLAGSGEFLSITSPSGVLIDSVSFPVIPVNHTYGRHPQSRKWVYFTVPTPENKNDEMAYPGMAGKVVFSSNGGEVDNVDLELSAENVSEKVHFSTDGIDPVLGNEFKNDLTVEATSTVRAVATKDNWLPGYKQSRLFYPQASSAIPVLALSMNDADLYGEHGIYTNYTRSSIFWERPVSMSYYNPMFQWSANAGIRIQGGNSVYMPKKAFRLFFRSGYGDQKLRHSPFKSGPSAFDKLVLRSGYDDDITITSGTLLRDPLSAEIWKKLGETATESDFVALYLNNSYWGIYNIRESIDENFVRSRLNSEDFDLVRFLKTGSELKYGSMGEWNQLLYYFKNTDFTQPNVYEDVSSFMDMNSILNLLAFVHCTAFRSWTWGTFGIKPASGKWSWTIWDTDRGYTRTTWNGFTEYAYTGAEKWSNIIPQKLIQNETFQHKLINRNCDLLNTIFVPDSALALMDSIASVIAPEIENEYEKWNPGNAFGWPGKLEKVQTFLKERPAIVYDQMKDYFSLEDTSHIRIHIEGNGQVQLNSIRISKNTFKGVYMKNIPIHLLAIPQKGAEFVGWKDISSAVDLEINPEVYVEITAVFKESTTTEPEPIAISEIMYHPKDQDGGEWIELYNPNTFTIDIASWRFTDSGVGNEYILPENTQIQPKNYLIIAGDVDEFKVRFPEINHVVGSFNKGSRGFNLSNSGETLFIYNIEGEEEDRVSYLDALPWPEAADGLGASLQLIYLNADNLQADNWGTNNNPMYTPASDNLVESSAVEELVNEALVNIYPNPIKNNTISLVINYNNLANVVLRLYDMNGRLVGTKTLSVIGKGQENLDWMVNNLKSGTFVLQTNFVENGIIAETKNTVVIVE